MKPKKRTFIKYGRQQWEVDFGPDEAGARRRPYFPTEAEADEEIKKYQKNEKLMGDYLARLPAPERRMVGAVLLEIKAGGLSLVRVWAEYQAHKKHLETHHNILPMGFAKVVAEFKRRKLAAGKTERYVNSTATFLLKFGLGREKQPIHEITADELEKWLETKTLKEKWSLSTKRAYTLTFSNLWAVAVAKGWASINIVDRLEPMKKPGQVVKIYSNEDALHIMAAALADPLTQKIIAPLALGLFGCMRPEEIVSAKALSAGLSGEKLFGWHDIDLDNGLITVRVEIAKTGDQRTIRLQPAAIEWLKLAKQLENPLPPVNERRLVDQCCELVGLKEWIRDGLRKNCCTHLRAVYKNDYDVVKDCGNSIRILMKHYAGLHVPEASSLEYWKITPDRVRQYLQSTTWQRLIEKTTPPANSTSESPAARSANESAKPVG